MREVVIVVQCDACQAAIEEEVEGTNAIVFTMRGEKWELDLCGDCLGGTFLQEARLVTSRRKHTRKAKKPPILLFECSCGKSFETERGLSSHQTRSPTHK